MFTSLAGRMSSSASRRRCATSIPGLTRFLSYGVLPDTLDRSSELFARNSEAMEGLISQLHSRILQAMRGGGAEAVKRNRSRNKFLPRERIERLIDPGSSFLELSQIKQKKHNLLGVNSGTRVAILLS